MSQFDGHRLTDRLWSMKDIICIVDDWATSKRPITATRGGAMPQPAEDAVAAVEQRRIDALLTSDINVLNAMIDEHCIHMG
jgi:hypothetical protein